MNIRICEDPACADIEVVVRCRQLDDTVLSLLARLRVYDAKLTGERDGATYVLAAVGFETTAPVWADLVKRAYDENIGNIRFLTALKTMPEAMNILARDLHIDGFLCPGHVAVITGSRPLFHLAETSGKPMVIGGFTPPLLLELNTCCQD